MIKGLLKSESTFATPVVLHLVYSLGPDAITYEPETINEYLRSVEPTVPRSLCERVNAALGLFTTNLYWQDPAVFNIVSRALNRKPFPTSRPAELVDMAWGVTEATMLLTDPEPDPNTMGDNFGEAIRRYIRYQIKADGLFTPPHALAFVDAIPFTPPLDDYSNTANIQLEADTKTAEIDDIVNKQTYLMLSQIQMSGVPIVKSASTELSEILTEYRKNLSR